MPTKNSVKPTNDVENRVLAFCNKVRLKLGRHKRDTLIKGCTADTRLCVISATIGLKGKYSIATCDRYSRWWLTDEYGHEKNSSYCYFEDDDIGKFVGDFDRNKLPHLVKTV